MPALLLLCCRLVLALWASARRFALASSSRVPARFVKPPRVPRPTAAPPRWLFPRQRPPQLRCRGYGESGSAWRRLLFVGYACSSSSKADARDWRGKSHYRVAPLRRAHCCSSVCSVCSFGQWGAQPRRALVSFADSRPLPLLFAPLIQPEAANAAITQLLAISRFSRRGAPLSFLFSPADSRALLDAGLTPSVSQPLSASLFCCCPCCAALFFASVFACVSHEKTGCPSRRDTRFSCDPHCAKPTRSTSTPQNFLFFGCLRHPHPPTTPKSFGGGAGTRTTPVPPHVPPFIMFGCRRFHSFSAISKILHVKQT